eukprot:Protomagalhaensia_wolfi_Nauph_80__4724@NODE_48_length_4191_cov_167_688584_g39_i0_p6_GENE_NODE_48_length_4191_cov_167_688584_g39_i0NODE_48_length_4191_cov_167_688584_g39_i0_p6_ORF_typecomplete_len106_score11_78RNase_P_p30/PF01876_16/3_5e15_NODE_48_length_4191_cov_167_688584_g39_i018492166
MIRQNVYFEVNLSRALLDPSCCRSLFRNLPLLLRFLPLNRLLVTSGASNPLQLRSPADLTPLIEMLGVGDAMAALSVLRENALSVLSRGAGRRTQGPCYPVATRT